jgi:beta-glucosidase
LQTETAKGLAKTVALQSIVLLENHGILPLDPSKEQKVAVIGPTADDQLALFSGYSFPVHLILFDVQEASPRYAKSPLQILKEVWSDPFTTPKARHLTKRRAGAPVFPAMSILRVRPAWSVLHR